MNLFWEVSTRFELRSDFVYVSSLLVYLRRSSFSDEIEIYFWRRQRYALGRTSLRRWLRHHFDCCHASGGECERRRKSCWSIWVHGHLCTSEKLKMNCAPYASFNGRKNTMRVFWSFSIWHWGYFCPFTPSLMSQQLI